MRIIIIIKYRATYYYGIETLFLYHIIFAAMEFVDREEQKRLIKTLNSDKSAFILVYYGRCSVYAVQANGERKTVNVE